MQMNQEAAEQVKKEQTLVTFCLPFEDSEVIFSELSRVPNILSASKCIHCLYLFHLVYLRAALTLHFL